MKKKILSLFIIASFVFMTGATTKNNEYPSFNDLKGFAFIPMGTLKIDGGKSVTIQAFYISKTEVTNVQYLEFLNDLKKNGKTKEYEIAKIDTALWTKYDSSGASDYFKTYLHKENYPVVNLSKEGAELYCKWLTEKIDKNNSEITCFRLPSNYEWEYAARGGLTDCPYPWGGPYISNSAGYLAQFKEFGLTYGPVAVKSFPANDWGLYDMSGNIAEMIADTNIVKGGSWNSPGYKLQILSSEKYLVSPMVGFRPVITYLGK